MKKKRNLLHIECMRILAAFFVIFNHTEGNGYFLFAECPRGSFLYWLYMSISVFCKISVPLFFMIAGALLLRKELPLQKIWSEKIMRMVLILCIFSLASYIGMGMRTSDRKLSVVDFFQKLYVEQINYSYWYIYAYIALLMALPFLNAIVKNITEKHYKYLIGLFFCFMSMIPCLEYILFRGNVVMYGELRPEWILSMNVFFPLIGYYFENVYNWEKCNKKIIIWWIMLAFLGIGITCYMIYYMHGVTGECTLEHSQTFHSVFIFLPCIAIYMVMKYLWMTNSQHISTRLKIIIGSLGSCTFGIYLLHIPIKEYCSGLWDIFREDWKMNHMLAALLLCIVVFIIGYVLTLCLKNVPGLKQLL